jgi:DNA topoisomerase-3
MTERIVKKAKEYDRDTVPGDYATLRTPCPNCGGVVKENYRRYACTGKAMASDGCGFSSPRSPGRPHLRTAEAEQFLRDKKIGPLEGFRSKAGWPFTAELAQVRRRAQQLEARIRLRRRQGRGIRRAGRLRRPSLGACPKCGAACTSTAATTSASKAVPTVPRSPRPAATSRAARSSCSSRWSASR